MKTIIYLLTLITNTLIINGQTSSVSADKLNVLYFNVDNPLTIVAENCACKDIIVNTSVGSIIGDSCKYTFRLNDTGGVRNFKAVISIFRRKSGTLTEIDKKEFRLKYAPKPFAVVGNCPLSILCY